jgi:hypothetical protein
MLRVVGSNASRVSETECDVRSHATALAAGADGTHEAISQLHKRLSVRKFGSDSNKAMKCMMHANVPHLDKTTAVYKL